MGYKLANGKYLSDDEIEKIADEYENDLWDGKLISSFPAVPLIQIRN